MSGAALPSREGHAGRQAPSNPASPAPAPASDTSKTFRPIFSGLSSHFTDSSYPEKQALQPTDFTIGFLPPPQEQKDTAPSRIIPRPSTKTTTATGTRAGTIAVILALLLTAVSVHCCDISRRFASRQHHHQELRGIVLPTTPAAMDTPPPADAHTNWEDFLDHRPTDEATLHPRLMNTLPAEYIPGYRNTSHEDLTTTTTTTANTLSSNSGKHRQNPHHRPRIIVIGDVHGELEVLQNLLRKVGYTPRADGGQDHVILAGDIINKGPDTPGVLDLAIKEGFSGVRGNHDDKLLKLFGEYEGVRDDELVVLEHEPPVVAEDEQTASEDGSDDGSNDEVDDSAIANTLTILELRDTQPIPDELEGKKHKKNKHKGKKDKKHKKKKGKKGKHHIPKKDRQGLAIIRSCTPEQRQWLANLPLILRVGHIPYWPASSSSSPSSFPSSSSSLSIESKTGKPSLKKPSPYGGEVVVVHGGLVPGIPLEKQDPWAVLHMRTLLIDDGKKGKGRHEKKGKKNKKDKKHKKTKDAEISSSSSSDDNDYDDDDNNLNSEGNTKIPPPFSNMTPLETREGTPWARIWDKFQQKHISRQDERTTVIFGHDAKAGLQLGEYTFGLDTGCVAGGKLTAMVFSEDEKHQDGGEGPVQVTHQIFSVKCRDGTPNLL